MDDRKTPQVKSRSSKDPSLLSEESIIETGQDTSINHYDIEDLVNRIDLVFSRESTDERDRKKVERFWKYFNSNEQLAECLLEGSANPSAPTSETSESEFADDDRHLFGRVQYGEHLEKNTTAMEALAMLKLKHLDQVALANERRESKVEGSPRYADEVIEENTETVKNDIKTFDKTRWGRKSRSPVKDRLTKTTGHDNNKTNIVKGTEWSLILSDNLD